MEAISNLASDNVVSFNNEFEQVQTALNNLSIPTGTTPITLPEGAVNTGISIANFIFNWAARSFREGTLTEAITCTNQPLQTYTDGLEFAFREGYINGILQQELVQAKFYYDDYAALAGVENGSWEDFNNLSQESYDAIVPIVERRNAAVAYISIIQRTANTHEQLAQLFLDGQESPSPSSCAAYFNIAQSSPNAMEPQNQPISTIELTPETLAQVNEILIDYHKEVQPLLKQMREDLKDK